ncbi:MAG TPA: EamA family transporter [Rhodoferax sp.]|jgi:multidrug transporter EmrE-like cation transporter|nr:EamA family transporter [Rhodoferax sp.]HNV58361.1 EamA family transporter [Rhodoferax sp.]HPW28060.1 EamA family transporter [Rhodoferax sp.]
MSLQHYLYVACTIVLTVYGQLVIKWQVVQAGPMPSTSADKLGFLLRLFLNPWILSGLLAALLASVTWMAAMTKLPLSHAYPLMSLAFVLVMILSGMLFHEPITPLKLIGVAFVILGLAIGSQG